MKINNKTLEKLRILINEETEYRSGPKLVSFFNQLGFNDKYGQGFPARGTYTDSRLQEINGTPELDKCIKMLFNPINYIDAHSNLIHHIKDFNKYLVYDGWQVVLLGRDISFRKAIDKDWQTPTENSEIIEEDVFLDNDYPEIDFSNMNIDNHIIPILENRFIEAKIALNNNLPLATIFQCGSILEGVFLSLATQNPKLYNSASSAPKDMKNKVLPFHKWKLSSYIDVSYEVGYIKEDVKKFSHVLRDYRNYIHPYQQLASKFSPDKHTAKICIQVLNAVCAQVTYVNRQKTSTY